MKLRLVAILILSIFCYFNAAAFTSESRLNNEADEQRAFNLFTKVKCLVCEAQTIDSSNSEFAYQLRQLIRQKILEHKSDEQIKSELVKEFGSEIITDSTPNSKNYLLWLLPLIAAVIGLLIFKVALN